MLRLLSIENFALIDRLEMEFGPGLNLITGETGSGKSILVDAVGLATGQRASAEMVRGGFDRCRVEAVFEIAPPHPAFSKLSEAGVESDGQLIIRREIAVAGANKVYVNGVLSTQGFLAELGGLLTDIHGQHDQQTLLAPRTHLQFLDAFARPGQPLEETRRLFAELDETRGRLEAIRQGERERLRRIDQIEFEIRELEALRLKPGLDAELAEDKRLLASAERRHRACREAFRRLYEDERSALARLGQVEKTVEELNQLDPRFSQTVEKFAETRFQLEEIAFELRDYADSVEFDPNRLEAVEERLAELQKAGRKYGATAEEMLDYLDSIRAELERLVQQTAQLEGLTEKRARLEKDYLEAARRLSAKRREASAALAQRVEKELAALAMEAARFEVALESDPERASGKGIDSVEFLISANPGEQPKPLAKVASGGELSRVILALKSILTLETYPKTLVFDEVDAGIGGRTASTLGEKLAGLARSHQVFCVTHLPQIAAVASHHFHVGKVRLGARTRIELRRLESAERETELARMLAGSKVTETTLRQARELLGKTD